MDQQNGGEPSPEQSQPEQSPEAPSEQDQPKQDDSPGDEQRPVNYADYDPDGWEPEPASTPPPAPAATASKIPDPPPPPPDDWDPYAEDGDGMLRMSFMDHLEELRTRIIRALLGFGIAFAVCIAFSEQLFAFVKAPLQVAVDAVGGEIVALAPMEQFQIIWMWTPLVAAIFLAFWWVIYQVWAFVSPGLYPRERRWAVPFIVVTGGLFVSGGLFAYFIALRYALVFLLGIGMNTGVKATISIDLYFTMFVNVILGVSVIFELPVLVFFLTLLRITTPGFLMRNSRYAVLAIVFIAALITPTPDVVNLTLFAVPMIVLYFLGVFASYLLVLNREGQKFPWKEFGIWVAVVLAILFAAVGFAINYGGYHLIPTWPFLSK